MLKERIQEIFEFTKSESPYRKANKGWINQDVFLDLRPSPETFAQKNEAAKLTVFWNPINSLLSNIFIIIIISSLLVFTSISLVKGRFNFNIFNTSLTHCLVKIEVNNALKTSDSNDLDSINLQNEQNIQINTLDKRNNISTLDDNQINSEQEIKNTKTDKQESFRKDKENNIGTKILEKKKSKSNFI